ncbi:MAG: aminoacyl-tRNA hydrolase [Cycloclasticus sp.]|nr:aminoacyl-tRNA hydrolase [Cycloclasticus sp.]
MINFIVGLGNPGSEYQKTRHNAGFLLLDQLADREGVRFAYESRFKADVAKCVLDKVPVYLIKPQTFMNKSGLSVSAFASYYDIAVDQILVVHDELDLEAGVVRIKKDGGHGGHNGLRDIIQQLGSKVFNRLRIGIGHPGDRNKVTQYVLKAPPKQDADLIQSAMDRALHEIPLLCQGEIEKAMRNLHSD